MELCVLSCRYAVSSVSAKTINYLLINAHGPRMHSYRDFAVKRVPPDEGSRLQCKVM